MVTQDLHWVGGSVFLSWDLKEWSSWTPQGRAEKEVLLQGCSWKLKIKRERFFFFFGEVSPGKQVELSCWWGAFLKTYGRNGVEAGERELVSLFKPSMWFQVSRFLSHLQTHILGLWCSTRWYERRRNTMSSQSKNPSPFWHSWPLVRAELTTFLIRITFPVPKWLP